ncbi:hypothetical protein ATCC90586_000868 [Pythium insidiosum]|nr:hypothetical protein ATCC90586_000868 [Pythium insidiosum]
MNKRIAFDNRLCYERDVARQHAIHQQKLQTIVPTCQSPSRVYLDSSKPPERPHLQSNRKRQQLEKDKQMEIYLENQRLAGKMEHILNRQENVVLASGTPLSPKATNSPRVQTPGVGAPSKSPRKQLIHSPAYVHMPGIRLDATQTPMVDCYLSPEFAMGRGNACKKTTLINRRVAHEKEQRIAEENRRLRERIKAQKPFYNAKKWDSDWQQAAHKFQHLRQNGTVGYLLPKTAAPGPITVGNAPADRRQASNISDAEKHDEDNVEEPEVFEYPPFVLLEATTRKGIELTIEELPIEMRDQASGIIQAGDRGLTVRGRWKNGIEGDCHISLDTLERVAQEIDDLEMMSSSRNSKASICAVIFSTRSGMVIVAIIGLINGEPKRLLYGTDYQGTTCGTGARAKTPLTFYPRMNQDLIDQTVGPNKVTSPADLQFYGVCVATCPEQYSYFCNYEFEAKLAADSSLTTEQQRNDVRQKEAEKFLGTPSCWFVAMKSETVFYRCIQMTETNATSAETCVYPADAPEYYDVVDGVKTPNEKCQVKTVRTITDATGPAQENPVYDKLQTTAAIIGRAIGDVQETWPIVLVCGAGLALVLGFVFLFMMKYCAGCFVWLSLWIFVLVLVVSALMLSVKGGIIKSSDIDKLSSALDDAGLVTATQQGFQVPDSLRASEDKKKAYQAAAYVMYVLSGIALLLVCFFQKKIRITVGIIKEASRAIQRMPLLVLFPIWPFLMMLVLFIYSAIIAAYIYSTSEINTDKLGNDAAATVFKKVNANDVMRILFAYHFFGFLWTNQLINAISMCTIAGAVCRYYWSREKNSAEMGRFPILYSFKNCFRYHFGSLAFGSLIIAIVQFIRAILLYIDHQTQDIQKSNLIAKVLMKVVQCCLWCLEKCLRFLSKNAYILIAMKGKSFCSSAKDAFKIIFTNAAQIATVSLVTFLLLSAAKITIAIACAVVTFQYIEHKEDEYGIGGTKEISSPLAPIILALILAWFVASTFLGVYEMAISTILLCFCEDRELNKESGQYFMSDKLRKFVASVPVSKASAHTEDGGGHAGEATSPAGDAGQI